MIRVLLVDDERLVLSSLRRMLQHDGFDVITAESAAEGLAVLEIESVDVIVSDYKMPGKNGVEFLREVAPRWPEIRRCMLTAQADMETLEHALAEGVLQKAFRKPWNNRELADAIRELAAGS